MAKNVRVIADKLGATVVGQVPETGGGAFGAARLARAVAGLSAGRPADPSWVEHPEVPMSEATFQKLTRLAEQASAGGRPVSPMQVAAQLLEEALAGLPEG